MDVQTPKAIRRNTRIRVEISVSVTSLDRMRPFAEQCVVLVVSAQGCGFRSSQALHLETPIMVSGLPGGGSVTGRVANCLRLGKDGKFFLIGVSLYTHGNVWGIADPPEDWSLPVKSDPGRPSPKPTPDDTQKLIVKKKMWPYNLPAEGNGTRSRRK